VQYNVFEPLMTDLGQARHIGALSTLAECPLCLHQRPA
jgi:hypothetical protein